MRSRRWSVLARALVLVLGVGCAKPGELANRTCFPTASWSGPAYSCVTGAATSSATSSSSSSSESESESNESEGDPGEIEMTGDPAPEEGEDGKGKGKGKSKKEREREAREAEKAAAKEKAREDREEREREKQAAKDKEREEREREKEKEREKERVADGDDGEGEGEDSGEKADKPVWIEGDEIRLGKKLVFKKDSGELSSKSKPLLDELVAFLADHEEIVKIEVAGYTDNKGDQDELKALSAERAKAVKDYLVDHGIKSKRVSSRGYGTADPIASNKTKAGRLKNRRIELHILKKKK